MILVGGCALTLEKSINSTGLIRSPYFPRVDDCIDQIGNAKYVSKFDLLKGYWQVPL